MMTKYEDNYVASGENFPNFTLDYISHNAELNPSDIAVIDNHRNVTYAEFNRHLHQFVDVARRLELENGATVAIEWTSLYPHWLLMLAFETLGIVTFTYTRAGAVDHGKMLAAVDLVICSQDHVPPNAKRAQIISRGWFLDVLAADAEYDRPRPVLPHDAPFCVSFTSGTTGDAKRIIENMRMHENRAEKAQLRAGFDQQSRFLVWPSFALRGIYNYAAACIRVGGCCVYNSQDGVAETIARYDVTHLSVLPSVLKKTLDTLPDDFVKPDNLTISVFGGGVGETLRARASRRLATTLFVNYSSNESGPISIVGPGGVGMVLPGVEVETVDDHHLPVWRQPGLVRVKSGGCIDSYDTDPAATATMFHDGWFYPGDVGEMVGPRSLKLIGRVDDLINIGGQKYTPEYFEERLRKVIQAEDFCVTALPNADGLHQLCIALVLNSSADLKEIRDVSAPLISSHLGSFLMVRVSRIPRTSTGKAQRKKLNALILEIQQSAARNTLDGKSRH
ncbi:MAG: class I adenylate-forming enzyme family protein [Proteobacteria bacterium]|nr:class I adenylate-forming enzyme family protein [Pseudomonadota bacterium]MDA1357615.1 class I adenylate-forming enzyme family protein [Pseudomonadota bacterium]